MDNKFSGIGKAIAALRQEKNMTLRELAEKTSITPQAISQYEKGLRNPSTDTLKDLAIALGVGIDFFLTQNSHDTLQEPLLNAIEDGLSVIRKNSAVLKNKFFTLSKFFQLWGYISYEHTVRYIKAAEEEFWAGFTMSLQKDDTVYEIKDGELDKLKTLVDTFISDYITTCNPDEFLD